MDVSTRILVIDDEISIRMLLQQALARMGWDVEVAETAEEALALFEKKPYDLMIVDKNLPGMNGVALIGKVQSQNKEVAFFIITAAPTVESAMESLEMGIEGYILKPFDLLAVMKLVRDAVEKIEARKVRAYSRPRLNVAESLAPAVDADKLFMEASRQMEAIRSIPADSPKKPLHIFVVSPNPPERRWMHRYFSEGTGDLVDGAATSDRALVYINQNPVDVIVADAKLDAPNIFEFLMAVKMRRPACECFVVSENPSIADVTQLIDLRATAVITKPLSRQQFEKKIDPVVRKLRF